MQALIMSLYRKIFSFLFIPMGLNFCCPLFLQLLWGVKLIKRGENDWEVKSQWIWFRICQNTGCPASNFEFQISNENSDFVQVYPMNLNLSWSVLFLLNLASLSCYWHTFIKQNKHMKSEFFCVYFFSLCKIARHPLDLNLLGCMNICHRLPPLLQSSSVSALFNLQCPIPFFPTSAFLLPFIIVTKKDSQNFITIVSSLHAKLIKEYSNV